MFADEWPLMPLEFFRREMRYQPWHFNGMKDGDLLRVTSPCDPVVKEYAWLGADASGRNELRQAIARAETMLRRYLKYDVAPTYREDRVRWPRLSAGGLMRLVPVGSDGRWLYVQLPVGFVQAAGIEARSTIALAAPVTYTDADGDGLSELATIGPISAAGTTLVSQVAVYFDAADRSGQDTTLSERWRIQPLTVVFDGAGNVTITGPSWVFVRPTRLDTGMEGADLTAQDTTLNFAQTVDIYRRYTNQDGQTNTTAQATVVWETRPCHGWWCMCSSCQPVASTFQGSPYDPAAVGQLIARVGLRDAQRGQVTPIASVYDATSQTWSASIDTFWCDCDEPDYVLVRTYAGYPLTAEGHIDPKWRKVVTQLACAELGNGISACKDANRQMYYWQQDLAKTGNDKELYATSATVLNNPFGTRRGHVAAWNAINSGEIQQRFTLI